MTYDPASTRLDDRSPDVNGSALLETGRQRDVIKPGRSHVGKELLRRKTNRIGGADLVNVIPIDSARTDSPERRLEIKCTQSISGDSKLTRILNAK
jgi:hypothetical protein